MTPEQLELGKRRMRELGAMAASRLAAIPKIAEAVVTAESDMSRRRLEVCKACDKWTGHTCTICGCFTGLKVRLPAEACPIGKWAAEG
jgi:hypothetical protein